MKADAFLEVVLGPNALSVVYQPIFDVRSTLLSVHALECLVRGPKGTPLERAQVLFEHVQRLGAETLMDRLCVAMGLRGARGLPGGTRLSLNVHASTLARDHEFVRFLSDTAAVCRISEDHLIIELVEHSPASDGAGLLSALNELRSLNMRIALDDVGVGHSNYQMIIDARPDYFKIDRQFVRASCGDPSRQAVLESVVQLASKLDAYTVAEGVETKEDLETVRRLGVDFVQGHLLSAPLVAEDAVEQLIGNSSNGKSRDDVVHRNHRKTILLVDDSNTSLKLEQTVLAGGPYRIITARNGREGVERAVSEQPDLIILDIVMPQMNGFEACRALRNLDVTRSTPVVMVTALHDPITIENGYKSGCNDFVFKPIFANELIEKVQIWLAD